MTSQSDETPVVELLPCPFCGGAADIESRPSYSQAANTYEAHRGWCDQCMFGLDWHNHERDAIAAWNSRLQHSGKVATGEAALALAEATELAISLFKQHYSRDEHYASGRVVWEPLPDTRGVISQISNMVAGMKRTPSTDVSSSGGMNGADVERLAVVLMNDDRAAAGLPPLPSRDDVPDSDGYVRNVRALLAALQPDGVVSVGRAADDVLAERRRQVEAEGWTPEHDDGHADGELSLAAALYAIPYDHPAIEQEHFIGLDMVLDLSCGWSLKPDTDKRRRLVKAGALILAEIERLDRLARLARPAVQGEEA